LAFREPPVVETTLVLFCLKFFSSFYFRKTLAQEGISVFVKYKYGRFFEANTKQH